MVAFNLCEFSALFHDVVPLGFAKITSAGRDVARSKLSGANGSAERTKFGDYGI